MPFVGQQLGKYRLIRLVGKGGMGEVYFAEDIHIKRQVAIKVIPPHPDSNKLREALRLFRREMQAIAKLDHPHILPLYDYDEATEDKTTSPYMVMPYCREGTLDTWFKQQNKALSPHVVSQFLNQAANALKHAHDAQEKILHLDIKPSNFLIRRSTGNPDYPSLLLVH